MKTATKMNDLAKLLLGMSLSVLVTVLAGWATLDYATPQELEKLEAEVDSLRDILTELRIKVGVSD